jgi:hypothetical protein
MPTTKLDTDYLVIGAGAMSLAFADVILAEDPDAQLVIVDRRASPGGHWNDAYPFVRLHQPSAYYGLNSARLGPGGGDRASGPEVVAYYARAMERFTATGRVRFLPMSEYRGDGRVASVLDDGAVTEITARRRIVDGSYMAVEVPSRRPPAFPVDPGVQLIPPNGLPRVTGAAARYVVIGAGKTALDALVFLVDHGVTPDRIRWVVPGDAWLINRDHMQPRVVLDTFTAMHADIAAGTDIDDVFLRLERRGILFRTDPGTLPSKWRCAVVDRRELAALRTIDDVVRLGRVTRIGTRRLELERGTLDVDEGTLFVDCTANGLARHEPRPVFADGRVTLQSVVMCQQSLGAALIGRLELLDMTDRKRNELCAANPHPERKEDLLPAVIGSTQNLMRITPHLPLWLRRSRVNIAHHAPLHRYLLNLGKLAVQHPKAAASMNRLLAASGTTSG